LPAVETLGSVTYICSDKTGTLTKNEMTVENVWNTEGKEQLLLHAFLQNNEVQFDEDDNPLGDSTETALVSYALTKGLSAEKPKKTYPLVSKIPFDSERMRMGTLHKDGNGYLLLVKGAPAKIAEALSSDYDNKKEEWLKTNREWASEGLRVLFVAYKSIAAKPDTVDESLESDLDFLGMVGMIDPPREEVVDAIAQCKTAGIQPVMITGDQPTTAIAIAERLKLIDGGKEDVLTGKDLNELDGDELNEKVKHATIYARVSPEQKLNIVK